MENEITSEQRLDRLIASTMRDLPGGDLVDLQRDISAIKYSLGNKMTAAEGKMLRMKERMDTFAIKERLRIQAIDKKLSSVKAKDLVDADQQLEDLRYEYIDARVEYSALKNRLDGAKDVLISLAKRIGGAEQEAWESRMERST